MPSSTMQKKMPHLLFLLGKDLRASKMFDLELAEGMPWEVWVDRRIAPATKIQALILILIM